MINFMGKIHNIPKLEDILNEDFYNPFNDNDETSSKPIKINDFGGSFKERKDTFSNAKIEFTRRDSGDYTIISRTMFTPGEIVEICPILFIGIEAQVDKKIKDTVFEIDKEKNIWGIVLGYGSLYKHSSTPNMDFAYNTKSRQMYFIAKRIIKIGEELTIDYGKDWWAARMNFKPIVNTNNVNTEQGMSKTPQVPQLPAQPSNENSDMAIPDIQRVNVNSGIAVGRNQQVNPASTGVAITGTGQQ